MDAGSKPRRKHGVERFILIALLLYFLPIIALYIFQREVLYFPHQESVGLPADHGIPEMRVVEVTTSDGLLLHDWFLPPKKRNGHIVVVFHGSFVNIADVAQMAALFSKRGYGIFLCEYRGFGESQGNPSEMGIYADARAGVEGLQGNGYKIDQMIFYGASLGTGVAVQMAKEFQPPILVLHSPFSSVADVAKERYPYYPIDLLLKDRFDSADKIGAVHSSLLIIHGQDDDIVPIRFALKLFDAANKPKEFYAIKGQKHNDLLVQPSAYRFIGAWIDKQLKAGKMP